MRAACPTEGATVVLVAVEEAEVEATPTGTISLPVDIQVDIQELETTAHLIPTGMTTLGLEVEVFWLPATYTCTTCFALNGASSWRIFEKHSSLSAYERC